MAARAGPSQARTRRSGRPSPKTFSELGVSPVAFAPISDAGQLIGFASISTDAERGDVKLAHDLAVLLEFEGSQEQ